VPSSEPVSTEPVKEPEDDPIVPSIPDTHVDVSDAQEVVIEHGEIESGNRVQAHDGHVRLRIRSDQLVLVEVEDRALSWLIPSAGDQVIEFDTSENAFKLELRHRKGGLVLRLRD
jgi:hypothetical protein